MSYSMHLLLVAATLGSTKTDAGSSPTPPADTDWHAVVEPSLQRLGQLVEAFLQQRVTPTEMFRFEQDLDRAGQELLRVTMQWACNRLEVSAVYALPKHVHFEASAYTRLNQKTPQNVWTRFGQIRLWRVGYRPTDKSGDATIFPLALSLGLVHGATPALAERAAHLLGGSGMTQLQTLERLRQDHGVRWGVKKLRQVTQAVSQALADERHQTQVERLLQWLKQAAASKGKHKPVISAGRDGITMGIRIKHGRLFEVATAGTVSVLDRRGRRLGTVYLAYTPESGQPTMSRELTRLLRELLSRWDGPLPRLCYVTDAGDNETAYYEKVLQRMKHPSTGQPLAWIRVVDYYHASTRIWTLAELFFGKGPRAAAWARKMQKWLKKPGGVNRVLHSAAALRDLHLPARKQAEFCKAYRYLRERMAFMRYADYESVGVPLGSGVTEAACKTVYTQRLKLSGMAWESTGAQTVLNLRVLQLSDVWDAAYARVLATCDEPQVRGHKRPAPPHTKNAA
jgi:hypothetical protein